MKSILFLALGLTALFLASAILRAEDWTTTDGKVYKDVAVVKAEPDAVTITHHDGGALVPLVKLSPDLQKRFNYDPAKAKAAADARIQAEAKDAVTLQAEIDQAQVKRRLAIIGSDPQIHNGANPPTVPLSTSPTPNSTFPTLPETTVADSTETIIETSSDSPPPNVTDLSTAPAGNASSETTHHSADDLVDINSRLKDDHPNSNRHTASSLLLASSYLLPDPLDPSHHSTAELIKSSSAMTPPSNTDNRHSTDSLIH